MGRSRWSADQTIDRPLRIGSDRSINRFVLNPALDLEKPVRFLDIS